MLQYKCMWAGLMTARGCAEWRAFAKDIGRVGDIFMQVNPILIPYFFQHHYVTLHYESGADPLAAMKIAEHSDYQTAANIYTHIKEDTLRKGNGEYG